MIEIRRDSDGKHWVNGKPFEPTGIQPYRKTALTKAVRMMAPFSVETLEGTMEGKAGDMLMIGASGEMYPCDIEIFKKTYAPARGGRRHDNVHL